VKRIVLALAFLLTAATSASADGAWLLWRHTRVWRHTTEQYTTVDWKAYGTYATRKLCKTDMEAMAQELYDSLDTQKKWRSTSQFVRQPYSSVSWTEKDGKRMAVTCECWPVREDPRRAYGDE
jgi:hypothetical protein